MKRERARLAKGEITQEQFSGLQSYYAKWGGTKIDPTTGTYSSVPIMDLATFVDAGKLFEDVYIKEIK